MNKPLFSRKSPCKDCPYLKDAPLAKWDLGHFKDVLARDTELLGAIWECHNNDGCVCVGWLMDQDNRRLPSISLRIELNRHHITREYMDALHCKSEMFESVEAMCCANFPHDFNDLQ
jgi:hypothetical protein